ncbi:DNA protecting protein DprA [Candidatus Woesebacteria bacterium RIFCSPHIGHO2_02_FULL_42_20]|uniref:DNA protecting protein DprA n=1 Tax=Candidatus Woesebacteria bacterium RIFCSPHIGHO2_12_FULL_41_24 TaxID=1802510 RepID=A0A1F8AUX4_9BACT|nr:MAG: DNA protecting protein DprA [Candidatus Woesebacteria bacterium RBG_16_41_13]OGM30840.1 MAG: DNA protecting protein DprA [Candidatus Woesebacteria bacterium RIFCSPHIGHO2_01_FULL_42_80]OGM34396.1 MAG: DNA protecting protein DprA [Candidatus Woesebacteria bacterium RIFCSPHIGHO2_02_FULL_42_20]OGM55531.1 MAG: DNA protecting protein DprA [Candidatus Woesebacteria bacterium RIFCSPHIGHO2_12_FULL_41_24]OGM66205.1 MAG: DNA protecting protein DprA [Candidatus Woesebacteria bacterium RIFCSPLOWO2_0
MSESIKLIYPWSSGYPKNLLILEKFAPRIYISGSFKEIDSNAVAIVGSRSMTTYGRQVTTRFAGFLASRGVTIVSGMARGVDTMAHVAALAVHGRTIAVLGSGIDVVYPPENVKLFQKIVACGAVVSQFAPGVKPLPQNFLMRNKLIAALSKAVVVVEGARRSGTFSIANHAANLGREVFAVPGPINSPLSGTPNFLIDQGARIATKPEDILDVLTNSV